MGTTAAAKWQMKLGVKDSCAKQQREVKNCGNKWCGDTGEERKVKEEVSASNTANVRV